MKIEPGLFVFGHHFSPRILSARIARFAILARFGVVSLTGL
jgi:hypothetical protein